jgi:hypothetical protein
VVHLIISGARRRCSGGDSGGRWARRSVGTHPHLVIGVGIEIQIESVCEKIESQAVVFGRTLNQPKTDS